MKTSERKYSCTPLDSTPLFSSPLCKSGVRADMARSCERIIQQAGGAQTRWEKLMGTSATFYDRWVREEEKGPQIEGLYVDDLRTVELTPWERKGGKGIYVNLAGQRVADAHICEIPPGGRLNPEKHMFEEMVLV